MAVHPQGQNQRQGEDAEREQGVHQHVQHGRDSRGRPDFHCRRETLAASRRYDMTDASISMHFITCCNCFMTSCVYAVTKCVQQGAVLSPSVYHCFFFSITTIAQARLIFTATNWIGALSLTPYIHIYIYFFFSISFHYLALHVGCVCGSPRLPLPIKSGRWVNRSLQ